MWEQLLKRIGLAAVISIVYLVPPTRSGIDDCEDKVNSNKPSCYVCDTRTDSNCKDPFDNSSASLNMTKNCDGSCIKVVNTHPEATWIRRACKEDVIKFSWLSGICLTGRRSDILMCVCNSGSLCNKTSDVLKANTTFTSFMISFSTLAYLLTI